MKTQEKLILLLERLKSKVTLADAIKVSRPTLNRYLEGAEPDKHDVKIRIDFLYFKEFELKNPSDNEIAAAEEMLLENQYLIDPKEEFIFKDYIKKIAFGSYELEADVLEEGDEKKFMVIAEGGELERDISRKKFLEMVNLFTLTSKVMREISMGKEIIIDKEVLKQWHYSLMQGIRADAGEFSSRIRVIENSEVETTHPREIQSEIERWVEKSKGIKSLRDIAISHALLEKIHPFGDGNGRIGRLVMAVQCFNAGFVPPLINKDNSAAYYASLEATQLGRKTNALALFLAEAIRTTMAGLPLLPKGLEAAKKQSNGKFLKYGYNRSFITMALCKNKDLLEAFSEQASILTLNKIVCNSVTLNELTLEFAYGSSKIEGSTFSKLDTKKFIEFGIFPDYKYDEDNEEQKEIDKKMALNNKRVFEYLMQEQPSLSIDTIILTHDIIVSGIRAHGTLGITNESRMVFTNGGQYLPVVGEKKIEGLLQEILERADVIQDPFAKSLFLHLNIAYIQPFEDGNKRTARAIANIPLIEAGLIPFSFDELNRDRYIDTLSRFYEYGDSVEKFGGLLLKSYEKEIEILKEINSSILPE